MDLSLVWSMGVAASRQSKQRGLKNHTGEPERSLSNRSILLLLGMVVAIFFVFSYLERINTLAGVRAEIVLLQNDLAQAEQRNAELDATLREVAESAYVGEVARSELGLIQPGDDPFVVLGQQAPATSSEDGVGVDLPQSQSANARILSLEWWRALFERQ